MLRSKEIVFVDGNILNKFVAASLPIVLQVSKSDVACHSKSDLDLVVLSLDWVIRITRGY